MTLVVEDKAREPILTIQKKKERKKTTIGTKKPTKKPSYKTRSVIQKVVQTIQNKTQLLLFIQEEKS